MIGPALSTAITVANIPNSVKSTDRTVKNIKSDVKNAYANNQYHNKLASEDEESNGVKKSKSVARTAAKAAPYVIAGTALLAYGNKAAKDKSLTKPLKDALNSVSDNLTKKVVKTSRFGNAAISGAIEAIKNDKEKNIINITKPKESVLNRFAQGAAWGAGVLGAHMLGEQYLKHKKGGSDRLVQKSYLDSQPVGVKLNVVGRDIIRAAKKNHNNDESEKNASIDWGETLQKGVIDTAATAIPLYALRNIARSIENKERKAVQTAYYRKKQKDKSETENRLENIKTASVNNLGIVKEFKKYYDKYGQNIANKAAQTLTTTAVMAPLVVGGELIRLKKREKQRAQKELERRERYDGRNNESSKRNYAAKHNISLPQKGSQPENG